MFSLTDYAFWGYFVYFIVAVFIALYVPGSVLLKPLKLDSLLHIPLSIVTGMVCFAYQGIIFGYLHIRFLSYLYLFVMIFLWIRQTRFQKIKPFNKIVRSKRLDIDFIIFVLIISGTLIQVSTVWFTGMKRNDGIHMCCGDPNDNLFYAAITRQIIDKIPPEQPGLAGMELKNYHYWSNLINAELSRIFHIPYFQIMFQYGSILISLLCGLLLVGFSKINHLGRRFTAFLLFFFYFGSDIIYLFLLARGTRSVFSMSSLEDGAIFLANLPRAYAVMVLFATVNLFILWLRSKPFSLTLLLVMFFSSLAVFKIYIGIFVYPGLALLSAYEVIIKRDYRVLLLTVMIAMITSFIYFPVNSNAGGIFYSGFWRFENFIVQPFLGLERLELARTVFASAGKWYRVFGFDLFFLIIYFLLLFGSKLIGFIQNRKSLSHFPKELNIIFITGIIVSFILGSFFQQTIGSSNSFNFLVSVFIVLSYYAALSCSYFLKNVKKMYTLLFVFLLILMMTPRIIWRFTSNITGVFSDAAYIPKNMVDGMMYLKQNTSENSLIAVDTEKMSIDKGAPVFGVLSERNMYFSGGGLLKHFQVNQKVVTERENVINDIYYSEDIDKIKSSLLKSGIDYLVFSQYNRPPEFFTHECCTTVYENPTLAIMKVYKDLLN